MPDLVIGQRRTGQPRAWRASAIAVAPLGLALVVAWFIYRRSVAYDVPSGEVRGELALVQPAPGAPPRLTFGASSLSWVGGLPVLRLVGDAHGLGAAQGRLLGPALPAVVAAAAPSIESSVTDDGLFGQTTHDMRLAWRWRFIDDGLLEQDRRMVAGLARGAAASGIEVGYDELLRDQAVLDVGVPSPRTAEAELHALASSLTVVVSSAQAPGRLWIARRFAVPGFDDGGAATTPVVTIAHPDGRLAWASVGWPGQLGVVTGVNVQGIALMVHPVRTGDVRPTRTARPVALLARSVLEQAKTLDEAVTLIEATPTLGAAVIVVVDGGSGKWVIVERTPGKAIVERAPKSVAIGDLLTTNALATDPENDRAKRVLPTTTRIERAARLARAPLPDVAAVAALLRDRHGLDDAPRPPGHRGVIDDGRAGHVVILDPASLELWVADPSSAGRLRGFDLRHELRGESERPAPPADVAADPSVDAELPTQLAHARAALRDARAALHRGELDRAAEGCARALTEVPGLPEALELDALVALQHGDEARARRQFAAWIDGGPDDPQGEERARAQLAR
jgi:hypothetical protein